MASYEEHVQSILNHLLEVVEDERSTTEPLGVVVTIIREKGPTEELQEVHTCLWRGRADAHVTLLERSAEALNDLIEQKKAVSTRREPDA